VSSKFTIVPAFYTTEHLQAPTFSKKKFHHVKRAELESMMRVGSVVPLDPQNKIWRYAPLWITNDFKATQRGKVSKAIPRSLQRVLESEINRRPMAQDYQA
jgi:hypothetical protein